jgi:hypothetical protein
MACNLVRRTWILPAFACMSVIATSAVAQSKESLENIVFSRLADYTLNRDEVLKQYCFMAQMETVTIRGKNPPVDHQWYYLRSARRKPYFDFRAHARMPKDGDGMNGEQAWYEHATDGKLHVVGSGRRDYRRYTPEEKKKYSLKEWLNRNGVHMQYFDPFDDLVDLAHFTLLQDINANGCERVFLSGAQLRSASDTLNETIRSSWRWKSGDIDCEITMDQSASAGGMPTYVLFSSVAGARYQFRSETRIRWEKKDDLWLPIVINGMISDKLGPGSERHYNSRLWWKVGEEVHEDFFAIESPDYRLPFMQTFGRQFDFTLEGAANLGEAWVRPEDMDIITEKAK